MFVAIHTRNDVKPNENAINQLDHQRDSSSFNYEMIKSFFIENLLDKWKILARELDVNENDIDSISREHISPKEKFSHVSFNIQSNEHHEIFSYSIDFGYHCK